MGPGMLTKLAAAAAVLTVATAAHAQAPGESASSDVGPKNPNTAVWLSLGGTAASAALVVAGSQGQGNGGLVTVGLLSSLVTPSLGEWYAGKPLTAGMGIRAASLLVTMVGAAESLKCLDFEDSETSCHTDSSAGLLIAGGLIGYGTGVIYDIATASGTARDYNRRHPAVRIQPAMMRTPSGNTTMGVGIGGSF